MMKCKICGKRITTNNLILKKGKYCSIYCAEPSKANKIIKKVRGRKG